MTTRIVLLATLLIGLVGCGQKGPLYSPYPAKTNAAVSQSSAGIAPSPGE
ncbi:LPS translocon maturation chaperone LptM [Celerinatantimonas yamalensis]|uniref:Lipoprotein n=1 Tax=Celerinatantimonas yamalensis TaxID=559956 RepID=A0ABW9G8V9_9GAMM